MPDKQVVLVTGAGSGLGQLTAARALAEDWAVAAVDINAEGLAQLGPHPSLLCITADVADAGAVSAAVARCEQELGPITRAVNAAAIMPLGKLAEQPPASVHKIMNVNYGGLINLTAAVMPRMLERDSGEFISYASMAGHWPIFYMGAYAASKAAVAAFTEVLYQETRNSGVTVLCVCPPIVATPLLSQAKATVWPRLFDVFAPIKPQQVLDEIEKVLRTGAGPWVVPGRLTRMAWRMRRWAPRLLWAVTRRIEGL